MCRRRPYLFLTSSPSNSRTSTPKHPKMDFQNRAGSKPGSAGVAGWSEHNVDRRERLRKLALETIDLNKDPYVGRHWVRRL